MKTRQIAIPVVLNGKPQHLTASAPTQSLLQTLAATGHHGTKEGCGDGDCGACTVNLLQLDASGQTRAIAVNSCLIPIAQLIGANIVTVEGVQKLCAGGALHPVQTAMVQHAGSQCGYCTPGFIMSMVSVFHDAEPRFDDASIEGNLCRCTGYNAIRRAMRCAAAEERFALPAMQSAPQSHSSGEPWFYRPKTLAQALQLKAEQPEAQWLAGATDLGLEFSRVPQHGKAVIAIEQLAELQTFELVDDTLTLGASLPLVRLEHSLHGRVEPGTTDPDLHGFADGILRGVRRMLHVFAAKQVRNRATIGGNFGTASPIGDLLPAFLALDAQLTLVSIRGQRSVAAKDYFLGYRQTALAADELVHSVSLSLTSKHTDCARRFSQSYKVGKRGSDDISIVAACFVLELDAQARIVYARLAYGGIAAVPIRALASEALLLGEHLSAALIEKIAASLQQEFAPLSDFRGSADYRRRLIVNLFAKFVSECAL